MWKKVLWSANTFHQDNNSNLTARPTMECSRPTHIFATQYVAKPQHICSSSNLTELETFCFVHSLDLQLIDAFSKRLAADAASTGSIGAEYKCTPLLLFGCEIN
ncbi:hypothetical protein CHARACLAT_029310 [Characodon lateralis]|uniref:Uncharacterized protein n=1 Tax=Characodon lateralis TaxID=208331 RepID=A0ABU7DKU6_9TELE|nr:hypothetical protein [Characodon lateralis]